MKKISLLIAGFTLAFGVSAQTSISCTTCEVAPNLTKTAHNYDKALWDVQLNIDPTTLGTGIAGVMWTGTEFWAAEWNSATINTADAAGTSTGSFTIPGVTGTRSMTTDGTDIYIGTANSNIYQINMATKTLMSTISTSVTSCRYLTYDPTLDSGAGGFWTGAYGSDITAVSMTGTTLSTISSATHGLTAIYGLAYDDVSSGGPYLWANDQGNGETDLVQLTMTGTQTGLAHDASTDLGVAGSIGGGLFICSNYVTGQNSIMGVAQGGSLFSYELSDPLADDCEMNEITTGNYIAAGNVTITGTIRNTGLNTITSVDIDWNDGTPHSQTFAVNIPSQGSYNFTHGTQLAAVAGNTYNITVTVTAPNDSNATNDAITFSTTALTSIPTKINVGEEKTGAWCQWCPRGAVGLANMESESDFIGIAVHNNDPMEVSAYDNAIGTYIPGGYPGGGVDRVLEGDPSASSFLAMHNTRKTDIVPCDVKNIVATLNSTTNQISVSADSEWYGDIPGDFRLSCVITVDDFNSSNQINAYGGGSNGSMAFPTGTNNSYDFGAASAPTSVPSTEFLGYDHVAVSLSNNNILGDVGSLPTSITTGIHSHTFADVSDAVLGGATIAHAIVMVVNANTGEILNAGKATISGITSVDEIANAKYQLNVYPNPTQDVANITFNLDAQSAVKLEVYNAIGSLVYIEDAGQMNPGSHQFTFDGNDLNSGFYFVNLTIDNKIISKKVSLLK